MQHYSEDLTINVGTGKDHSITQLAEITNRVLDAKVSFKLDASKPDGMMKKLLDVSKLTNLGWHSECTVEKGIQLTYESFLKEHN